jgi:hypothetical protein
VRGSIPRPDSGANAPGLARPLHNPDLDGSGPRKERKTAMSEDEKKNGEYEKPESHEVGGDELEGVAGGTGGEAPTSVDNCKSGYSNTMGCYKGTQPGVPRGDERG